MDNSYIITSNLVCKHVAKIIAAHATNGRLISTEAGTRIWWISMHHKINQHGVTQYDVDRPGKYLSRRAKGEFRTYYRSLGVLRKNASEWKSKKPRGY